jgi:RNA polymerase sigma factor (sigma-70 family)
MTSESGVRQMASENYGVVLRGIERIFNQGSLTGLSEGQLLRQFATGDEGAFEALVTRHGPMVLGVCRRLLYDRRDVEDAFQATFLVLLRKAGALRDAEALSPWLHGVAYRVAARIRCNSIRRPLEESRGARPEAVEPECDLERTELRTLIDEEIRRLPEKYRLPVVLCYLEGRTHEEAARRLRCSAGSVRGRLDRARQKLKDRLTRRGLAPAAGLAALAMGGEGASAAVPAPLIAGTVATLARAATAKAVSVTASTAALELADGVFRAMIVAKLKLAASFLAAGAIILAVGTAWLMALSGSFARDGRDAPALVASRGDGPTEQRQDIEGDQVGPTVDFRIVDQRNGKPLPGVALTVNVDRQPAERTTTDDAGRAAVAVPAPLPRFLSVVVRKDGFAPLTLWFPSPIREAEIPASYSQAMYASETIGGVVRDERGRPVAGVRVAPTIWTSSADIRYLREDFQEPAPATTDAEGRWQCEGMPAGIDRNRVSIAFTHTDYERVNLPIGQALEDVRRGKATVLPRGLELAGRVVDPAGRPILGAKVLRGSDQFGLNVPRAETDADGRFRFAHVPAGETVLTVQAWGYAPALEKAVVRPGLAPVEFRLERGRTVQGRVVDAKGEPLAGATVHVDGWRGHRTLDWRMTTDDEGEFRWTDAPPDAFWVDIWREGYLRINRREVPPAGGELTIAMNRQLKVRGTVVDAETRHAVKSFTLVPGMESGGFSPYWDRGRARPVKRGQYEIQFDDTTQQQGRRLRVEADGYMPAVSRVIRDDEDDPVVNFVVHKAAGISGIVHSPDGSPLAGADIVRVSPSQPAFFTNGLPPTGNDHRVVKTGIDGRFAFPAQEPPYTIVVLHDRGFAEQTIRNVDVPPLADLKVRPWGRIEGTLRIGRRPGTGQTLNLAYERQGDTPATIPWWSGKVTTDDEGRFVFERVMPGEVTLSREILIKQLASSQTVGHSNTVGVEVAPGATARLTMGGTGRPVVGKVTVSAGFAGAIDWTYSLNSLIPKETPIQMLIRSVARKRTRLARGGCTIKLEADGSFRAEDVEAGTYDLLIMVNKPPRDPFGVGLGNDVLATARREVVVPPMTGDRSDEPLDLGAIPVTAVKNPEAPPAARKP